MMKGAKKSSRRCSSQDISIRSSMTIMLLTCGHSDESLPPWQLIMSSTGTKCQHVKLLETRAQLEDSRCRRGCCFAGPPASGCRPLPAS